MKKLSFTAISLILPFFIEAQTINIPDPNFKTALLNHLPAIDTNGNNEIEVSEALNVTAINISNEPIITMTGIEAFTNLTNLECNGLSQLTSLDVSSLTNLQTLNAGYCSFLASLNLSGLVNLQTLNLQNNFTLSNINTSGLLSLSNLDCSNCNQLTSLNLSGNNNLVQLNCSNSQMLNSLNVNNLTNLQTLTCSNCNLTSLDLSNLTSLNFLNCSTNEITSLNTTGANNIISLNCSDNYLTSLTVSNMTNLTTLNCDFQIDFFTGIGGITNLDLTGLSSLTTLQCNDNKINSLDLSDLNNLTHLSFGRNLISSIDLSNLTQLTHLNCSENNLSTLDVSAQTSLLTLLCYNNNLTNLNTDTLVNIESLNCSNNNINLLNVANNLNLTFLACANNQLTALDVSNLHNLGRLNCDNNHLTNLNVDNLGSLTVIEAGGNLFTNLDFSNTGFNVDSEYVYSYYRLINSQNLVSVNLKNGLHHTSHEFNGCSNLVFVCADEINIPSINSNLQDSGITTVQVNSYCSFVPGGINNTITGTITVDTNNKGCDVSDYHPNDLKVTINDGTSSGATFTNNGNYLFYTQSGSFSLTPQFQNPYFTITPLTATLNFPTLDSSTQTQDFCITPNGIHSDVDVTLLPILPARPGFNATYQLIYKNKGNQTVSGSVTLSFDDAVLDFVSSSPNVDSQMTNVLSWNYANLLPFESRNIYLTLNVNAPTETPAVNINDVLNLAVLMEPLLNDETAEDNIFNLNQTVIGSYDPNDKTCLEGAFIPPTKVGDYLHYLIRFQNSGTAPAENIVVKDIIDTSKFDLASLQLTSTSHPQVTRITDNKVEFIFENIQLPAEQNNESGSHGYVAFKIRTKNNLVLGNTVSNTADIYFDYNFPIVTNTATTTIAALSANEFENTSVVIAPNPVKNNLTISANDVISSIQIYDVQGRLITTQVNNSTSTILDMSQQNVGVYFVKVITEKGIKVEKMIKE